MNSESLKVGLKIHKGKTKYTTNHADSEDILIDQQKIEKVTIQIPRTKHTPQRHYKRRNICQDQSSVDLFWGEKRKYSKIDNSPLHLKKKQVMDQCVLPTMTYGCQTWSLNKQMTNQEPLKEQWKGKCWI